MQTWNTVAASSCWFLETEVYFLWSKQLQKPKHFLSRIFPSTLLPQVLISQKRNVLVLTKSRFTELFSHILMPGTRNYFSSEEISLWIRSWCWQKHGLCITACFMGIFFFFTRGTKIQIYVLKQYDKKLQLV